MAPGKFFVFIAAAALAACGPPAAKKTTPVAAAPAAKQAPIFNTKDPEAIAALQRMGAYLRDLKAFEIRSQGTMEESVGDGLVLDFGGSATYRVRRPDRFFVETDTDRAVRQFFYDGSTFTVNIPRQHFFAAVSAPPTIRETVDYIYNKSGIVLPLADLFYWSNENAPTDDITAAMRVGYAKIDGADTDQYVFRGKNTDWQIWIQRGDQPLPRRIVITTRDDEERPRYAATLSWNTKPAFAESAFKFRPAANARPIALASLSGEGQ